VDLDFLAVLPHAHYLAKEMEGTATLPGGEKKSLLKIKEWDFNWQSDYQYEEPIHLPKGTRIDMRFTYDNSSQNVRNLHQPPVPVRFGPGSGDEMGELWFQILPGNPAGRRILDEDYGKRLIQEALEYHSTVLRDNPTNAHSHVQLAKALINVSRPGEALDHLRRAVQINPNEEEGHYHIGVLLMDRDAAVAETAFMETIRVNPENFKAHNNLGLLLMRSGRLAEAEVQFRSALELNPGDKMIQDNLKLLRR
jgi:tetratricopeptide (TPR) repeat protein